MPMNYSKSLLLLGFVVPGLLLAILFAGVFAGKTWLDGEYSRREQAFQELKQNRKKAETMEAEVLPYRGAVAFFQKAKRVKVSQELPPFVEGLCSGKYQGYIMRTSLNVAEQGDGKEEGDLEFLGRYDSLQRLASELQTEFPYLQITSASFRPVEPTMSIPSKHISATFKVGNEPGGSGQQEGGQ